MVHRVFVSSTTSDLAEHRQSVCEGVRRYLQTAVSMDSMGREGAPTVTACLETVDSCDLYLGLIGASYGTVPERDNPGRLSFTELEYRRAYQSGKEVHWFVKELEDESCEAQAAAFRKEIEERHNPGRFRTLAALAKLVDKILFDWSRRKNLERELTARYCKYPGQHRFKVVPSAQNDREAAMIAASAREFVSYIIDHTQQAVANNVAGEFVVGISGGNAQKLIVEFIAKHWNTLIGGDRDFGAAHLVFLALNSASLPDRFTHTANFLAARLSQLFPGSRQFSRLRIVGPTHQSHYEAYVKALRIVLGGAAESDGFLLDWFRSLSTTNVPTQFFGDFCYVPVDRLGQAIPAATLEQIEGSSALDIHSGFTFNHLREVKVPVILPLSKSFKLDWVGNARFTKKGRIGDLVLRHVANCICILDEYTASRLLSRTLCGYQVRDDTAFTCDRRGNLYQPVVGDETANVDAHIRIVHQDARLPRVGRHPELQYITEILISDPPGLRHELECRLLIEGQPFRIDAATDVRRPGMWSTTLVRTGLRLLREAQTATAPKVLDMGCGCGVIGCLMASLWICDTVVFADIESRALDCARRNVDRLKVEPICGIPRTTRFEYVEGNLFQKLDSSAFDLVLFCPPFLPTWGLQPGIEPAWNAQDATGLATAVKFAEAVSDHLLPGGLVVVAIAGYVDYAQIEAALAGAGLLLQDNYPYRRRRVLYPYFPPDGWPVASEIQHRAQLEEHVQNSTFRDEYWKSPEMDEPAHYLAFDMMHIVAAKPRVRGSKLTTKAR